MPFDPDLAAIRFGTGLSPVIPPPATAGAMMRALLGPDEAAARLPIPPYAAVATVLPAYARTSRARREGSPAERAAADAERAALVRAADETRLRHALLVTLRSATARGALRERLALFWADHFTAVGKNAVSRQLVQPFVEEAIRPRVAGSFADLLVAVETHPVMLTYLDQPASVGPGSRVGRNRRRGLNENLAREMLELHTVGAGGPYGQGDVRELAELLTGLGADGEGRLAFRPERAEPGPETVLGVTYSGAAGLDTVEAALRGLAAHPATAGHLARKMAVHFVSDAPDEGLVGALAETFRDTAGDLAAVTATLLDHPAAWAPARAKVKPPLGFVASALRALGVDEARLLRWDRRQTLRSLVNPLGVMGQPWGQPDGPDGWPEAPEAWVTPQFMAGRIDWAMNRPEEMLPELPDPREFVRTALGPAASPEVLFAARAAERPSEGVGVVLASPDFQRR